MLGQKPSKGRLSAYDHVTLIVAKADARSRASLIGLLVERAKQEVRAARARGAKWSRRRRASRAGSIFQLPRAGVAAAPGMHVRIAVAA